MRRAFMRAMWGLRNDQRGAVLLYVTFSILPLLMVVGVAIDFARVTYAKQKLTNGADAAALAVGAQPGLTLDAAKALAQSFVLSHFSGTLKSVDVSDTGTQVNVTAAAQVSMVFMQVFSSPSIDITVGSLAVRPQGKLEIALVLDETGSMAGQRINDLKLAAKDLIDIVVWDKQTADYYSKVAIVPYAAGVNVGAYANSVRGSILSGTCLVPGCLVFQFTNPYGALKLYNVSTCVSERIGAQAYTDAAPSTALVATNYPPASNPCPTNTIVPLTNDKTLLKGQIDALQVSGSTAGHIGLAWGWYMLSPNWGYLWPASQPAAYSELTKLDARGLPLLRKILILMTDGEFNTAYCNGVVSRDSTSGNAADRINCDATNGGSFSQSDSLCSNTKAAGIIIYTIGFGIGGNQEVTDFMTRCATDASHAYLTSTGAELRQAFRDIATRIASLRLTN